MKKFENNIQVLDECSVCEKTEAVFSTNMDICDKCFEEYLASDKIDEKIEDKILTRFMVPDFYLYQFEK